MTALDVVSLQEAKDILRVQFDEDDEIISQMIRSAVTLIEAKTAYRLFERAEEMSVSGSTDIYIYPFVIDSVVNLKDNSVVPETSYTLHRFTLRSKIFISSCTNALINMTVGYDSKANIPPTLIDAVKKMIVYLYQNRDNYKADIPSDVYMLIQPFMRFHGI